MKLIFLLFTFSFNFVIAKPIIQFEFENHQTWQLDKDNNNLIIGLSRYIYSKNEKIDMKFIFTENNLLAEINNVGEEQFFKKLYSAQEKMNWLVSDEPIVELKKISSSMNQAKKIIYQTRYRVGNEIYETQDVYYLYKNHELLISLTYPVVAEVIHIKEALAMLDKIKVYEK